MPAISRATSLSTSIFDDEIYIAQVLAERRKKPQLTPLITSIAPGQYGPPLQRRQHLRGNKRVLSETPTTTPIKVVEEEVVEYTPIEEGGGWMRQRRVSRDGDWVVLEQEILGEGVI
jgi:hypothetical protein